MNNINQLDYLNKDWTSDHDSLITRYSQEFPRHSSNFKDKFSDPKPWGPHGPPL
jgi:hypothetical protein